MGSPIARNISDHRDSSGVEIQAHVEDEEATATKLSADDGVSEN